MKAYRADKDAAAWEAGYRALLKARGLPKGLDRAMFEEKVCCLLCSEADAALGTRTDSSPKQLQLWRLR